MKNMLIVGGSSGIGLEIVKGLNPKDYNIIVASRTYPEVLKEYSVQHIVLDVSEDISNLAEQLPDTLHGLAYCPGTINLKPFHRLTKEDFLQDYQVNALGAVEVLQTAMKSLRKAKGASVVLFSTVASKLGMNFHSSIAMAKSAVEGLAKSLAAEWASHKVRVNAVAPSLTDTPLASKILSSEERIASSAKRHPLGRVGEAEDIAELALFLLSDKATWITGQIFGVDGGMGNLKP